MTIASEIQRIQTNIANAYDALEAKGATMPATENTDNLVTTIDTISGGGGDVVTATNNTGNQILAGDKVWVNENNGSYNIENFNGGITNYTVVGNPTFYKGFAAGFSVNDYLTISNSLAAIGNTFYYHFNIGSRPSSILTFRLYTLESFDALLAYSNGNLMVYSWSAQQFTTLMTASYNTEYWLRVRTSVGQRSYAISTDGITYGTETVITDTTYGPQPSGTFYLGGCASASEYWNGFLYLNDCYITDSNGVEIWRAYEPNLTENTLMGYAQENIASGSTGEVLTLIQPQYYAYKDFLNRYVYCKNLITSTDFYYDLNARSDNGKATSISELTVPTRAKPVSVTSTSVTFNIMPYYRSEQDDLY